MNDLFRALRPVKNRIRLGRLLSGAAAGFAFGAAAALVLLAVTSFVPLENRWGIAGIVLAGGILLFAAGSALRRVEDMDAARAADACGLQERVVTAVELGGERRDARQRDGSSVLRRTEEPSLCLASLQRQDACEHLRGLDVRRIPLAVPKRRLAAGAGLLVLCAGTLLIPGGGDRIAAQRRELREKTAAMVKQIDEAAAAEEKELSDQEKAELRKLTAELKRELDESRDSVDALVALDKAEQRMEELRRKTAGDAMREMADALRNAGLDAAAQAMENGDAAALQAALSELSASDLQQLAEGLSGEAGEAAEQLAQMMRSGELSEAQLQAMMSGMQNPSGALQQALSGMKAALGGSQQGSQQGGQNGGGAGTGQNGDQAGGGAGAGSANEEQKGAGSAGNQNSGAKGNRSPEYKEGQYETIYDPEKADTVARDVSTEQNALGKDSVQIETGPGKGSLNGDVPYREVVGEYAKTEVQAAESAHLTQEQKEWVDEYFRRLTEE